MVRFRKTLFVSHVYAIRMRHRGDEEDTSENDFALIKWGATCRNFTCDPASREKLQARRSTGQGERHRHIKSHEFREAQADKFSYFKFSFFESKVRWDSKNSRKCWR